MKVDAIVDFGQTTAEVTIPDFRWSDFHKNVPMAVEGTANNKEGWKVIPSYIIMVREKNET